MVAHLLMAMWTFITVCACIPGCGAESAPLHREDAEHVSRAKALFEAYIGYMRSNADAQMEQQMDMAGWRLATVIGYDFKADADGWECWYRWATQSDPAVVDVCLRSPNPVTRRLGADIAFASREEYLVHKALKRIADDRNTDMQNIVADWLMGRGLRYLPSDREHIIVGWDRVLVPNEEQWRRICIVLEEYRFAANGLARTSR